MKQKLFCLCIVIVLTISGCSNIEETIDAYLNYESSCSCEKEEYSYEIDYILETEFPFYCFLMNQIEVDTVIDGGNSQSMEDISGTSYGSMEKVLNISGWFLWSG